MSLGDELPNEVESILATKWQFRDGQVVPEAESVRLGNDAVKLTATVLYADLAESTDLVNRFKKHFAAEVYKSYLHCATKIIRASGGVVTAFDGDRVMGVFIGDSKNTNAARCALKINHAVVNVINPSIKIHYPSAEYSYLVRHAVGVDTSDLIVARTGIRGSNDLVWVGRAANYAAKLCSLREGNNSSWITADVYNQLSEDGKNGGNPKQPMWTKRTWTEMKIYVYSSNWTVKP